MHFILFLFLIIQNTNVEATLKDLDFSREGYVTNQISNNSYQIIFEPNTDKKFIQYTISNHNTHPSVIETNFDLSLFCQDLRKKKMLKRNNHKKQGSALPFQYRIVRGSEKKVFQQFYMEGYLPNDIIDFFVKGNLLQEFRQNEDLTDTDFIPLVENNTQEDLNETDFLVMEEVSSPTPIDQKPKLLVDAGIHSNGPYLHSNDFEDYSQELLESEHFFKEKYWTSYRNINYWQTWFSFEKKGCIDFCINNSSSSKYISAITTFDLFEIYPSLEQTNPKIIVQQILDYQNSTFLLKEYWLSLTYFEEFLNIFSMNHLLPNFIQEFLKEGYHQLKSPEK